MHTAYSPHGMRHRALHVVDEVNAPVLSGVDVVISSLS
jgi:hypothetical protein